MSKTVIAHCQRCHKEMRLTRDEKQKMKVIDIPILCDECYAHYTNMMIGNIMNLLKRRTAHEEDTNTI